MSSEGSITRWLDGLQAGDEEAIEQIWYRFFPRLVGLARTRLRDSPRRMADEEDVALSAFDSFCRHAEAGRYPRLMDRDGLWRLLVVVTARKAAHLKRDQTRQKRGGATTEAGSDNELLGQVLSAEPGPELAAQVADECRRLLGLLPDPELQRIALLRMEGYTVEEIAAQLDYVPRSIGRKLQVIRALWETDLPGA
jgi:DNA-directed RNA polymerase specialized sigma24 family protein